MPTPAPRPIPTIAALARLIYPAEAKELADFDVISNLPAGAPFRGPGGPPMAFALEQAIDEAALRMKVDPIALRKRWDPDPNRQRLLRLGLGPGGAGATANRSPRRAAVIAAASASPPATGFICGSPARSSRGGGQGRASGRQHRDAGYRHRHPHRDRQYGRAPVRAGAAWRSRSGSAIQVCRKGRARGGNRVTASVIPPMLLAIEQLKASIQQHAKRQPVPGSNAPWREMLAGFARPLRDQRTAGRQQADWRRASSRRSSRPASWA